MRPPKERGLTTEVENKAAQEPELPLGPEGAPSAPALEKADEVELQEAAPPELQKLKEAARFATPERAVQVLEALFFAAEKPLDLPALQEATQFATALLQDALAELQKQSAPGLRGVMLVDLGGRWQLRTPPEVGAYVRRMLQVKP